MTISSRGRYGLRAMIDIAVYGEEGCISLKSIAQRQQISEAYLEQLVPALKKAGLLTGVRGTSGGYYLAMPASEIKAGDILRALEHSLTAKTCGEKNYSCKDNCSSCVSSLVLEKMQQSLNDAADSISLQDLADEYRKNEAAN